MTQAADRPNFGPFIPDTGITADERTWLADLERLVRITTPTGDANRAWECATALRDIAYRLFGDRAKVYFDRTPDGPLVRVQFGSGPPTLGLFGHYDIVQDADAITSGTSWFGSLNDPVVGPVIYGPGTYDMKAGIIAILYGMAQACRDNPVVKGVDPFNVVLCFVPDEEEGSRSTKPLFKQLIDGGMTTVLSYEGAAEGGKVKIGRYGGMWPYVTISPPTGLRPPPAQPGDQLLRVTLTGREGHPAAVANHGSALVQAALDVVELTSPVDGGEPAPPEMDIIALDVPNAKLNRTPSQATYVIRFRSGQAPAVMERLSRLEMRHEGVTMRMFEPELERPEVITAPIVVRQAALDIVDAAAFSMPERTVTPTMVERTHRGDVRLVIDCRSRTPELRAETLAGLVAPLRASRGLISRANPGEASVRLSSGLVRRVPHAETTTTVGFHGGYDFPPFVPELSADIMQVVEPVGRSLGMTIEGVVVGGVGDVSHLARMGIKTQVDGLGPDGGEDHSSGERCSVRSVGERIRLTARLVPEAFALSQKLAAERTYGPSTPPGAYNPSRVAGPQMSRMPFMGS